MKKFTAILLMLVIALSFITINAEETTDIPSDGLMLWVKADSGVVTDEEGYVTEWKDNSGKGNNLAQTESLNRCPYYMDSEDLRGTQKTVSFESNQYLASDIVGHLGSSTFVMYYKPMYNAKNQTIFSSAQYKGSATRTEGEIPFTLTNSNNDTDGVQLTMAKTDTGTTTYNTAIPRENEKYMTVMMVVDSESNTVDIYHNINGDNKNIESTLSSFEIEQVPYYQAFALGLKYDTSIRTRGMVGEVAEMMIYDRALSLDELNCVNRYLKFKYDIPTQAKGMKILNSKAVIEKGENFEVNAVSVMNLMDTDIEIPAENIQVNSENPDVVSVDSKTLTAVSSGKSVITVTDGGEFSASFVIYVPDIMVGEPEITGFSADETMTCIVPVSGTETSKVAMLVSVYKEGVLVDFKCIEKTELTENDEIELSFEMPEDITGYETVVMVVDSLETLTPICEHIILP